MSGDKVRRHRLLRMRRRDGASCRHADTAGEYRAPGPAQPTAPRMTKQSFMEALQKAFQYMIEFVRVIHEQGVAVAVEALQAEFVAEF